MSQTFHCPSCGAPLDPPSKNEPALRCPFCSTSVIVPASLRSQSPAPDTLSRTEAMSAVPQSGKEMIEIIRMVKAGQKEEAIVRFREVFDSSRQEAQVTIERIEQNQVVQLTHPGALTDQAPPPAIRIRPAHAATAGAAVLGSTGCLVLGILIPTLAIVAASILFGMIQRGGPLYEFWLQNNPFSKNPLILSFGGEGLGDGLFTDPEHIAVDRDGNLFVSDFTTGRIQQFDPQGNFVRLWDAGDGKVVIRALEVDRGGILYAAVDRSILRYDTKTGAALDPLPNPDDYFFQDFKVLSDGGFGAVVDGENLARLNPDGSTRWLVEEAISSVSGESDTDGKLAVNGNNQFYLAGSFVESVFVYSPEGKFLNRFGSEGTGDGQFTSLTAIAVDGQGRVLVDDWGFLEVFEADGRWTKQLQLPPQSSGVEISSQGLLYVVTREPRVYVYEFK